MITLIVQMFGRTETTQHADEADMFDRLAKIASAQQCRIERNDPHNEGEFIAQVWIGSGAMTDSPTGEVLGAYQFTQAA